MIESAVERLLVRGLEGLGVGALVLKLTPRGQAGYHDRLVLLPDALAFFVELKRPGGRPRKLQAYRERQLRNLGFKTALVDTPRRVALFVRRAKRELAAEGWTWS